jgi:hypothetical protein
MPVMSGGMNHRRHHNGSFRFQNFVNDVLPKLGNWPINRVAELTPTAWQAAHKKVV